MNALGWYRKHFLLYDWAFPILISGGGLYLATRFWCVAALQELIDGGRAAGYAALAAVAGSLLGFVITVVVLSEALLAAPGLQRVRDSKNVSDLNVSYLHAIAALGALTLLSLVAIFADSERHSRFSVQAAVLILSFATAWKVARAIRFLWRMMVLSGKPSAPSQTVTPPPPTTSPPRR